MARVAAGGNDLARVAAGGNDLARVAAGDAEEPTSPFAVTCLEAILRNDERLGIFDVEIEFVGLA